MGGDGCEGIGGGRRAVHKVRGMDGNKWEGGKARVACSFGCEGRGNSRGGEEGKAEGRGHG